MHFILFLASKHTLICGWSWIWIRKGIEWKWDDRGVSLNHAFFLAPLKSWEERNPSCPAGVTEGHPRDKPLAGLPWQPAHPDCRDSHPLHSRSNKTKEPQNKNCLRWTNTSVWQGNRGRRLPLLSHDPEERVFTAEDRRTLSPLHFCSRESAAHSEDVLCFVVVSVHSSEV